MEFTNEHVRFFVETLRRNNKTVQDIYDLLHNAWPQEAPSFSTVYRYHREFEGGTRSSLDDGRLGHSGRKRRVSTEDNINSIRNAVEEDPHVTIDNLVQQFNISHGTVHSILTVNLHLKSLCSKWIPYHLNDQQKLNRLEAAQQWVNFFSKRRTNYHHVVFIDEKWFQHRSVGLKQSNRCWVSGDQDRARIVKPSFHSSKSLVIVAISFGARNHVEVLQHGESIDSNRYVTFLKNMHHNFSRHVDPLKWEKIVLIHDNARPHCSATTAAFLHSNNVKTLKQPAYSPDFNMLDRWLFAKLDRLRENQNFTGTNDLFLFLTDALRGITLDDMNSQLLYLKNDMTAVVNAAGEYL